MSLCMEIYTSHNVLLFLRMYMCAFCYNIDVLDYIGGTFSIELGREAQAQNCTTIQIVRDIIFEDIEDFTVDLSTTDTNVVVGRENTTVVQIDDLGKSFIVIVTMLYKLYCSTQTLHSLAVIIYIKTCEAWQ